ncbi:unnamed protein product [Mycena citricolor]|uniref:Uncharacterized protein n=1 Tax=Mycena citricolor TaxID=2018698 RepID=A0AAD2HRG4_9AGAR|nr:unnamed protein product [Mycena citricolor]
MDGKAHPCESTYFHARLDVGQENRFFHTGQYFGSIFKGGDGPGSVQRCDGAGILEADYLSILVNETSKGCNRRGLQLRAIRIDRVGPDLVVYP